MKLTSRGRYAIIAMLDLAMAEQRAAEMPTSLAAVAERNNLSQQYLEKLFIPLRRAGLVVGARGPGGGYRLAHPASQISVGAVLTAVDRIDATSCGGSRNCAAGKACLGHDLWTQLNVQVMNFLDNMALAQLVGGDEMEPLRLVEVAENTEARA